MKLFAIVLGVALPAVLLAQPEVNNVVASQRTDGSRIVDISYDLKSPELMAISVLVSSDGGATYPLTARPQFLTGSVGPNIAEGQGLAITWDAGNDAPGLYWPSARVKVVATGSDESASLTITSTVPEGTMTQVRNQTIRFAFDRPVEGFDASDVILSGAEKGTFVAASASDYTLEIAGTGGSISLVVNYGGDTYSYANFYQDIWTVMLPGSIPLELIRIPAGAFTMGSPGTEASRRTDEVQHDVLISQDFYLGRTEVTQLQWEALTVFPQAQGNPGGLKPVANITWNEASDFVASLNAYTAGSAVFSLPTESQWEYACRAGSNTRFYWGDGLAADDFCTLGGDRENYMWYCGNASSPISASRVVRQKLPNAWGLFDMHGNVLELCSDWYGAYPTAAQSIDPTGAASGTVRVIRGGYYAGGAFLARAARRDDVDPTVRGNSIGLRVAARK